ncbi:MAG TPA: hypothetical protein VK444_03570 [Methanobacteriaceae archaeon]|nr:hypothetical protein [Methanobacteriaceae archaeon]
MQRNYKNNSIPNLRKKTNPIDDLGLNYINIASCLVIGMIMILLLASVIIVAAAPNSNFPAGI